MVRRTVLITGAAQGIGAEVARVLVARRANVGLVDIQANAVIELGRSLGSAALPLPADVRDLDALEQATASLVERYGGMDAVVVNAAVEVLGDVADMDPEEVRRLIDIDLVGAWNTARAALPAITRARGYLLFVTSLSSVASGPHNAPYNAAKAGVVAMAKTLRLEVGAAGVSVGVVYLGYVDTDTGRRAVESPLMNDVRARVPERMLRPVPVRVAAEAVVRGIERRSRRITVPRSGIVAILFPELAQRLSERWLNR